MKIPYTLLLTLALAPVAGAVTTATNYGSLGAAGDGTTMDGVTQVAGAIAAGGDQALQYSGGTRTTVGFQSALNPVASSPFTIEFWAKPDAVTDDNIGPSPVFNRPFTTNRSGWVFFQRGPSTGWNLRMFDGNGSGVGWDLTGGTNGAGVWSHVVAVWSGTAATLYVNGVLADDTNAAGRSGGYAGNSAATISLGSYSDGNNIFNGAVDEFALYNTALSPAQITNHYTLASSPTAGDYSSAVIADGAVEYLPITAPVPEPAGMALAALSGLALLGRRRKQ
jgi:uncharacterized protein (TIGR03382 family)